MQVNKIPFSRTVHYYGTSLLRLFQRYEDSWWVVLPTYLTKLNEDEIKNGSSYKISDVQLTLTGGIEKSKGQTWI